MRSLAELCGALTGGRAHGRTAGVAVRSVTADSRAVRPGALFVCLTGARHDGHAFVPEAVRNGAVAVVAERPVGRAVPVVVVRNARRALAELAAEFHGHPSRSLDVIGITGTNGKTTTAYMLESILKEAGRRPALVGTVECRFGAMRFPHVHTTPDAPALHALFAAVLRRGADAVAMEVSSHALVQDRVTGVAFRAGVFTNLTRDHLDYHGGMGAYFRAKALLFERLPPGAVGGAAILNADSPRAAALARCTRARVWRYAAARPAADASRIRGWRRLEGPRLWSSHAAATVSGTAFTLHEEGAAARVRLRLLGAYNVSNALAAAAAARSLGVSREDVRRGLERLARVPGRMERVPLRAPFAVVVDYAHTPDALERALASARRLARRKVIVVFGCGGNRDRGKRPRMGAIAARRADASWVTSDNPRDEAPDAIIADILAGIHSAPRPAVEPDRRRAIAGALRAARAGDLVLVAGKGHERTQVIRGAAHPFDDAAAVRDEWARTVR